MNDGPPRTLITALPASRTGMIGAAAVLAMATVAVHMNGLDGPFLPDDVEAIVENPHTRVLLPLMRSMWAPNDTSMAGRPIPSLSLAFNYAVGKLEPRGYHVFNLAVHFSCVLAAFAVLRRLFRLVGYAVARPVASDAAAFSTALLWGVHPLWTECVNYVVVRTELMMGLFLLLTVYCFLRSAGAGDAHDSAGTGAPASRIAKRVWAFAAVGSCAAGMLCKEVMVVAPVLVLLIDRMFLADGFVAALKRRGTLYGGLALTWGILAALLLTSSRSASAGFGLKGLGPLEYLNSQWAAIVMYLKLTLFPAPLVVDYHDWPRPGFTAALPHLSLVAILATAGVWAFVKRHWIGLAAAWFFVILAPSSSIIPIATELAAERRVYLPSIAVIALVVVTAGALIRRAFASNGAACPAVGALLLTTAAGALGVTTFLRNRDYQSAISIWEDTVRKRPGNSRAHVNLGVARAAAGQFDSAMNAYRKALELDPRDDLACINLGEALSRTGRRDEARGAYARAIELVPTRYGAHYNLGMICLQDRDPESAIRHLAEAVRLRPLDARMHRGLGRALLDAGRKDEADRAFATALKLDPEDTSALLSQAHALRQQGRLEDAATLCEQALAIDPRNATAHHQLAVISLLRGRLAEFVHAMQTAIELRPDFVEALGSLAWVLASADDAMIRDPLQAESLAARAVRLTEERDAMMLRSLAAALAAQGRFDEAIATAERAKSAAQIRGQSRVAQEMEIHLKRYRDRLSWRLDRYPGG